MRLHRTVAAALEGSGLSLREAARKARIDPGNLSRFVRSGRGLGVDGLDRLLRVLDLRVEKPDRVPEWIRRAEPWVAWARRKFPEMDSADLHQIVTFLFRPLDARHFLILRGKGGGYAF